VSALERGEKYFKRTLSTTVGSPGYRIQMGSTAGGVPQFTVNGTSGLDVQIIFQLAGIVVNVNGVSAGVTTLQGYTEFGSLFDEFAIDSIDLQITPSCNMAQATSAGAQFPLIGTAIDYDDALDTTILQLQQYETFKMIQPVANKPAYFHIKPRGQNVVLGIGTTYASLPNGAWMDCAYPATNLFGFKMALDAFPTGAASAYWGDLDIQCTYHMRFRDVR
jgi:ASC-1-like (ASCH) protein